MKLAALSHTEPVALLETFIPAREAARMIGVKVGTLAKWRFLGKGPKGWLRASTTMVVYPLGGIEAWKAERAAAPARAFDSRSLEA